MLELQRTRLNDEDSIESLRATQTPLILARIASGKIVRVFENVLQFLEFVMILIQLNGERKLVRCL